MNPGRYSARLVAVACLLGVAGMPAIRARQTHAAEVGQMKLERLVGRRDADGASMEAREIVEAAANAEIPPPAIYPTWAFEPAEGRAPAATDHNAADYARVLGLTIPGYLELLRSDRSSALVEVSPDGIPGDSLPLPGGFGPHRCVELLSGARYLHWTIAYRDDPYAFRFDISTSRTDSLGRIGSVLSSPMRRELIAARYRGRDSFLYLSNGARVPLLSHAISAQFLEDGVYLLGVSGMTQGRDGSGSVRLDRWAWDGTPLEFVDLHCFGKVQAVRWGREGEVAVLVQLPDRAGNELIVRSTPGEIGRRSYPRSEESVYLGDVSGGEVLLLRGHDRCEVLAAESMAVRASWVHPWGSLGLPPGTLESTRLRFLRDGRVVCVAWAQIETPSGGKRSETRVSVVGRDGKVGAALEGWPTELRRRRGERGSPSIEVDLLGNGAVLVSARGEGAAVYEIPEPE